MARSAFRESVQVFVDRNLSPAARSHLLAETAKSKLADLISSGRATPNYEVYVDGRRGADEETVKPDSGLIHYDFNFMGEAVVFAMAFLRARSPVSSGRYRDSFMVAVDGRPVPPAAFRPESVPRTAEVIIYNTTPYSRKVDVQLIGTRPLHFPVPPFIFADAVAAVRGRFGNSVSASRLYSVRFPGQYLLRQHQYRTDRPHQVARAAGTPVDSPALVLKSL